MTITPQPGVAPIATQFLMQNQARLLSLLEHSSSGVLCADSNGLIRLVNAAFRRHLGTWTGGPGQPLRHCAPLLMGGAGRDISDLLDLGREFDRELMLRLSQGVRRTRLQGRVVRDLSGRACEYLLLLDPPVAGPMDDLERDRLERQLRRSQRMESFGLLSAGIVHDLNNVLACILGAAELLDSLVEPDSAAEPYVRQIRDSTQRGALMTRKVLSLARLDEGPRVVINFNQVIHDVMVLLRRSVDPRIGIRMHMPEAPVSVLADTTTLHQLLMNLCVNARDAMPEGGELMVRAELARSRELRRVETLPGESHLELGNTALWNGPADQLLACVEVRDTGTGMEPEVLERIFDPFFTTKDGSRGTGLGLAMVLRSMEELGGCLRVRTRKDWGTSMRLFFPHHALENSSQSAPAPEAGTGFREVVRGKGRIMVVDDDEVVRTTMCDLIRTLGYDVEAMPDGLAAVEAFLGSPKEWDLILLDLMMPRMDGVEALRRIRAIRQDQPVLVVTGFAGPQNLQKLEQIATVPLLMKPIQIRELSRQIATMVN
jgi:two-component system cell cycle sensor histidine kinase/response regulator CckA